VSGVKKIETAVGEHNLPAGGSVCATIAVNSSSGFIFCFGSIHTGLSDSAGANSSSCPHFVDCLLATACADRSTQFVESHCRRPPLHHDNSSCIIANLPHFGRRAARESQWLTAITVSPAPVTSATCLFRRLDVEGLLAGFQTASFRNRPWVTSSE